jgi:hypothetical protein
MPGSDRRCRYDNHGWHYWGETLAGIRHDRAEILCMQLPEGVSMRFLVSSLPLADGAPRYRWPSSAAPNRRIPGYTGPDMHWCGPDRVVVGYNGQANMLQCAELVSGAIDVLRVDGPLAGGAPHQYAYADGAGSRYIMHACPEGWALVGLHLGGNTFLCGLVYRPGPSLAVSDLGPLYSGQPSPQLGSVFRGMFLDWRHVMTPFTDELLQTHFEPYVNAQGVSRCTSPTSSVRLRDRFNRDVEIAHGARGAVALRGGSGNTLLWFCGSVWRSTSCPPAANVADVAGFLPNAVWLRCLRRTPAPWTP